MELTPVVSSNLAAVGYDQTQNVLYVQFKNNATVYEHHGVPVETYEAMKTAESIGSFYAKNVRSVYKGHPAESGESK